MHLRWVSAYRGNGGGRLLLGRRRPRAHDGGVVVGEGGLHGEDQGGLRQLGPNRLDLLAGQVCVSQVDVGMGSTKGGVRRQGDVWHARTHAMHAPFSFSFFFSSSCSSTAAGCSCPSSLAEEPLAAAAAAAAGPLPSPASSSSVDAGAGGVRGWAVCALSLQNRVGNQWRVNQRNLQLPYPHQFKHLPFILTHTHKHAHRRTRTGRVGQEVLEPPHVHPGLLHVVVLRHQLQPRPVLLRSRG